MSGKQVWFALPAEYSQNGVIMPEDSPVFTWKEFSSLRQSMESTKMSQHSLTSPFVHLSSSCDLSQYSLRPSMESQTNEMHSTTDSQEVLPSQLELMSNDQYVYDDANSTSSQQNCQHGDAVNSVIMEVSGELMLGNYVPHKHQIVGSESSDLSNDDARRFGSGGVIAKYPESLSVNDWNPYATESDTNETPWSLTSSASDDHNKIAFVSKATINIVPLKKFKEPAVTISMRTDENTRDRNRPHRVVLSSIGEKQKKDKEKFTIDDEKRTDLKSELFNDLRYTEDSEELKGRNSRLFPQEEKTNVEGTRLGPPNNARSHYINHSKLEKEPVEFSTPVTAAMESFKSLQSDHSESIFGQQSMERQGIDKYRRESGKSTKGLQSDGTGGHRSGRQSTDSGRSNRGCHSEVNMSEGGSLSDKQLLKSHKSFPLEKSRGSNHSQQSHTSSGRFAGSDHSGHLDLLSEDAALHFKSLTQSEDAQRMTVEVGINAPRPYLNANKEKRQNAASGDSKSHLRYVTRSEPYLLPVKSAQSPVRNVGRYVNVAERERLLLKKRDVISYVSRSSLELEDKQSDSNTSEKASLSRSATQIPRCSTEHLSGHSPSDVSMKRVAALVEETKRQTREAVAIPRPDPSGSEERFPLHERLTLSKHDDSFKIIEKSSGFSKVDSQNSKSKDSVTAKSVDSEERVRVLWKYTYDGPEKTRKDGASTKRSKDSEIISAAEPVENRDIASCEGDERVRRHAVSDKLNPNKTNEEPDDEKAKKVKAVLLETGQHSVTSAGNTKMFSANYVSHTLDYTQLQRDLKEIQDCLPNYPTSKANDNVYALRRQVLDSREDMDKSLNTTGTTCEGRESGVSDFGKKLLWDHGADLQYDHNYSGQFLATTSTTDVLSSRFHGSENMDKLVVRPDSTTTDDTENKETQFDGPKTLTGSDITCNERLLEQVQKHVSKRAFKESVEDIVLKYRNERQDLIEKYQTPKDYNISNIVIVKSLEPASGIKQPSKLTDPNLILPQKQRIDEKKQPGLTEHVYRILIAEQDKEQETDNQEEKGMTKKIDKILSTEQRQEQVDGILSVAMAEEHEMAKKMSIAQADNSSLDNSRLNESADSLSLDDQDVRKRLQWSQFSSPGKGNKSDFAMVKEVTSVPYSALNNANSLLSTQLKKMSERNFDKSIELQTPYCQALDSRHLYQVDRETNVDTKNVREAWMPDRRSCSKGSSLDMTPALSRDIHSRSRSEESGSICDLSQYSIIESLSEDNSLEWNNIRKTRDFRIQPEVEAKALSTQAQHRTQETASPNESDTSSSRKESHLRPYRPAGSRDVYYTKSGNNTNDSGTTIESTHPGSDDAAPPYIPVQYLGNRKDGEEKHSKGIYGNRKKDALSTVDENSIKCNAGQALTASIGSSRNNKKTNFDQPINRHNVIVGSSSCMDQQDAVTLNFGYHNNQQTRQMFNESSRSLLEFHSSTVDPNYKLDKYKGLEKLDFKTRKEVQRVFEKREQELKELLSKGHSEHVPMPRHQSGDLATSRHQPPDVPQQCNTLGTSIRSDPGGMLEGGGSNWEYRFSDHNEFQLLIPEPLYPQENLQYNRSKSDSDLIAMSPTANQKYSSPMLPGTRFLELTSQHSPIFNHHDSMLQHPGHPAELTVPLELPRVGIAKELRHLLPAKELPRIYDRRLVPSTEDFTIKSSQHLAKALPSENISRSIEPREFPVRPLEPEADPRSLNQRLALAVRPRQFLDSANVNIHRSADVMGPVYDLDPLRVPSAQALTSDAMMTAVELGADPKMMAAVRQFIKDVAMRGRSKSPFHVKQKEMEAGCEKLNKHLSDKVGEIQEPKKPEYEVFEDNFPPSKRTQVQQGVPQQEYMENLPPSINEMWARFKETKEQSKSDSSLNSMRLDTLEGLLKNPTHHAVNSLIQERTKLNEKKKIDKRENFNKLKEENSLEIGKHKKRVDVKAVEDSRFRFQEMTQQHGTSEENSNGSYSEIQILNRRKKEKVKGDHRSNDKEKNSREKRSKSPTKKLSNSIENDMYLKNQKKDETCLTDSSTCTWPTGAKHVGNMGTLFSIPEVVSFEQSPSKAHLDRKSRPKRHNHIIDPLMRKLHDKIRQQRIIFNINVWKKHKQFEKPKMLLTAKREGHLSDKAIDVELENVSSATSYSESSHAMSDVTVSIVSSTLESDASTHISDSSTLKDSSIDSNIKLQVKKYPESFSGIKKHVVESTSTYSSDCSNIVVERIPKKKSEKQTKDRKGYTKGKKVKVQKNENNKNSKDNQNRDTVGLSKKDMQRQPEQYATYLDSQRQNKLKQDASTMYPSPNHRIQEVLMKSKSIQTSLSVCPTSPTHACDEVPVAAMPYMSNISDIASLRQPLSALSKSIQTYPSRTSSKSPVSRTSCKSLQVSKSSKSPVSRTSCKSLQVSKSSKSPVSRTCKSLQVSKSSRSSEVRSSKSTTSSQRDTSPAMIQKQVCTADHKYKNDFMLPKNSMFSPESDENALPPKIKEADAWFVPLKTFKPWRQPLKERQAFSIQQEPWKPVSVSHSKWKNIMHNVSVKDMNDLNVSTDTKFALDPEGQLIEHDDDMMDSDDDFGKSKPLYKMSLQEAFETQNPVVISRLRQRQKRLRLAAEWRKMEAYLKLERDKLFQEDKKLAPNPDAHPYSDNLHKPEKRVISKEEMKEMTEKKYKKLPEVLEHQKLKKRQEEYSLNRLKARLFNRKIQRKVLVKAQKCGR